MASASASDESAQWYAVYTKPRQEKVAQENLQRQGYDIYLPLVHLRKRKKGKLADSVEPLFPRYLFIRLQQGKDNWGPIRSTIGAIDLVKFGQNAAVVPDDFIRYLRENEGADGAHQLPEVEMKKGQPIRLADGPLAGYEAVFLEKTSKDRVLVLLRLLGGETRVNIDQSEIELSP